MTPSALGNLALFLVLGTSLAAGAEDKPRPAVKVRLVHPDEQATSFLAMFEGSRAPDPAAALAAWQRATGGRQSLGKLREALIALGNPQMLREWRTLDGAELTLGFDPADGQLHWFATVPREDGTLSALATAIVLTDGASEAPIGIVAVDRLGPPGAPLLAHVESSVALASSRQYLRAALAPPPSAPESWPTLGSGILIKLEPDAFGNAGPLSRRRLVEGLRAAGCRQLVGTSSLQGEEVSVVLTGSFALGTPPAGELTVDPAWLDAIPASPRLAAAFAMSIDPRPPAWDAAFATLDRIERADPARAGVAPVRTRLNLLAVHAGVRLEADFWPRLIGISGAVFTNPEGEIDGVLLALQTIDAESSSRIAQRVLPALATAFRLKQPDERIGPAVEAIISLGRLNGRTLSATARGATVHIAWGANDLLVASLDARSHPERSAGPALCDGWGGHPPQRVGAFWPGRISVPDLAQAGSPLVEALKASPPLLWQGRSEAGTSRDQIQWSGLRTTIRGFLNRLPLDPPPPLTP